MFLAAEGFLIFSPQSSLLLMKPRKTKITAHWVLMLLAMSAAIGGKHLKQLWLSARTAAFTLHSTVHSTLTFLY